MKSVIFTAMTIFLTTSLLGQNSYEYFHHFEADQNLLNLCKSGDHQIGVFGRMFGTEIIDIASHQNLFETYATVEKMSNFSHTDCDFCLYDLFDYDIDFPGFYFAKSNQGVYKDYFIDYFNSEGHYEDFLARGAISLRDSFYLTIGDQNNITIYDKRSHQVKSFIFSTHYGMLRGQDEKLRIITKDSLYILDEDNFEIVNTNAIFLQHPSSLDFKWHGQLQKYVAHTPSFTEFLSISNDTITLEHMDHLLEHFDSAISGAYLYFMPNTNHDIILARKLNSTSLDTVYSNTDDKIRYNKLSVNTYGVFVSGDVSLPIGVSVPIIQNLNIGQEFHPQRCDLAFKFVNSESTLLNFDPSVPLKHKIAIQGEIEIENKGELAIDQFNLISANYGITSPYEQRSNIVISHHLNPFEKVILPFKDTIRTYGSNLILQYELAGADYKYDADQTDNLDEIQIAVATKEVGAQTEISLFPNPAADYLFFNKSANDLYNAIIYTSLGKLEKEVPLDQIQNGKIEVAALKSGYYFLKLYNNDSTRVLKFIKI